MINVVWAKPTFVKIAPLRRAMDTTKGRIEQILTRTGRHYDKDISEGFFFQLEIPKPNINLRVDSGYSSEQAGQIRINFEKMFLQ